MKENLREAKIFFKALGKKIAGSCKNAVVTAAWAIKGIFTPKQKTYKRAGTGSGLRTSRTGRKRPLPLWQNRRFMTFCGGAVVCIIAAVVVVVATSGSGNGADQPVSRVTTSALPREDTRVLDGQAVSAVEAAQKPAAQVREPAPTATPAPTPTLPPCGVVGCTNTDHDAVCELCEENLCVGQHGKGTCIPLLNLHQGVTDEEKVPDLQQRLMKLGYMDSDEPTDYFGPATHQAVVRFQQKNELEVDGHVGEVTWDLLFSGDAKKYSATIGMEGDDILDIQVRLRELGYIEKATGLFGEETEAAVKNFQEKNGLTADGSVGFQTKEKLYAENVVANYIGFGEESETVKTLQARLQKLGYLTSDPDGKYGRQTVEAVKLFQNQHSLVIDGYFGLETKELLMSDKAEAHAFSIGSAGSEVERIQQRLKKLNYLSGSVDGYFGGQTEKAVRAFQKRNGLSVDGKCGKATQKALFSDNAKKAASSSSGGSSSGSSSGGSSSGSSGGGSSLKDPDGPSVNALIAKAKTKIGKPYSLGAKGPNKFDCSGFVWWCLKEIGVKQGYITSTTWRTAGNYPTVKKMSDIKAGDIICFKPHHVGIAISGSQMIDAASGGVKIRSFKTDYWTRNFVCARRIF